MLNSDVHYPVSIDQSAALHLTFNFYLFLVERASHMHQNVLWHGALYMDSLVFFDQCVWHKTERKPFTVSHLVQSTFKDL